MVQATGSERTFKRDIRRSLNAADVRLNLVVDEWPAPNDNFIVNALHSLSFRFPSQARGEARCVADNLLRDFTAMGSILLIPANVPMQVRGDGGRIQMARLEFPIGRFPAFDKAFENPRASAATSWLNITSAITSQNLAWMIEELKSPGRQWQSLFKNLSENIAIDLERKISDQGESGHASRKLDQNSIDLVQNYIMSHPTNKISVSDLADLCGLSARHFTRVFRATTGETVYGYIERHRIQKAKLHLADGQLPIKQIAFQMGYADVTSFSAAFRRTTGQSPGAYRISMTEIQSLR